MNLARFPLSGQPDRLCDLIASGIADEYLRRDSESRVRLSVSGGNGALFVNGEVLTTADFDVTHLVQRLLGQHGLHEGVEPFVSIEQADSSQVGFLRELCPRPVMGFGYATNETEDRLPRVASVAKLVAKIMTDKRLEDPDWFWLGTSGAVCVDDADGKLSVNVTAEHGTMPLAKAREAIAGLVAALPGFGAVRVETNTLGEQSKSGLKVAAGRSGSVFEPYGRALPSVFNPAGTDWHDGRFLVDTLARQAALHLLNGKSAQAVFVRLRYGVGERKPSGVWARDERGRDMSAEVRGFLMDMGQAVQAWARVGLMTDAIRCGMAGDANLPWDSLT